MKTIAIANQKGGTGKGVVVQRVVGGNRQRARTLRNRQHIVLLRKLLRDLLNGGHIDVGVLDVDHFKLEALGQCLQDLTLIDVAKLLQSLADAQVAVLFLVVFFCAQDAFIDGISAGAVKG